MCYSSLVASVMQSHPSPPSPRHPNPLHWPHTTHKHSRDHTHIDEPRTTLGGRFPLHLKLTPHSSLCNNNNNNNNNNRVCGKSKPLATVETVQTNVQSTTSNVLQMKICLHGADPSIKEPPPQTKVNMCISFARSSEQHSKNPVTQSSDLSPSFPHTLRYRHHRRSSLPVDLLELTPQRDSNPSMSIRSYTGPPVPLSRRKKQFQADGSCRLSVSESPGASPVSGGDEIATQGLKGREMGESVPVQVKEERRKEMFCYRRRSLKRKGSDTNGFGE